MDIDVYKLRCSTSIADCSLLTLKFGNMLLKGLKLHDEFLEQHCSLDYCVEPFVVLLFAVTAIFIFPKDFCQDAVSRSCLVVQDGCYLVAAVSDMVHVACN